MIDHSSTRPLDLAAISPRRLLGPHGIPDAWAARRPGSVPPDGRLLIIAADHPARGALGVREDRRAMASRSDLLRRLAIAVTRPGVDGVLGTADILEDLLLAGLLGDRMVFGSMNRAGLQGAIFEFDDRFTAYDSATIARLGLDGGKMLTRVAYDDPATAATLAASGRAVTELAAFDRIALVEPFLSARGADGWVRNLLDPDSVIMSIAIAAGLGATSARTWLKLPVVPEMDRVLDATTLPTLLLGGDPTSEPAQTYATWRRALACPPAVGLVVGRSLLYPPDGDVAAAVDIAADLVHGGVR